MSGFEIAGVVLGAIPLIIAAVDKCQSGLDAATIFWKWRETLTRMRQDLLMQRFLFESILRTLLDRVASPAERDDMLMDFRHELWKSQELVAAAKNVLGQLEYDGYILTIQKMEGCMKTLSSHLDLDRQKDTSGELEAIIEANPPTKNSTSGLLEFEFGRRVKLMMKRREIRSLLEDISSCNDLLNKFFHRAAPHKESNARKTSWKFSLSCSLPQLQDYATSLHQALSRAWSCSVSAPHSVHLFLEDRIVRQQHQQSLKPTRNNDKPTCFKISLKTPCNPRCWHQVEVQAMKKRKVAFKHPPPDQDTDSLNLDELKVIDNLCSIFCRQATPMACAGLGLDPQGQIRGMYQATSDAISFSDHFITLDNLLFPSPKGPRQKPLSNHDRYLLAITLASSFLQLHTTPWLSQCWNKADVLFPETKKDNLFMADVRYPLVMKEYACGVQHSEQYTGVIRTATGLTNDDSVNLLTLAKLLLEIRLNDRVEQLSEDLGEDGQPNEATEIQMLGRWIRQEEGNLSHAWLDAITCCMKSSTDPFPKLQDPEYRQTMINGIVVPLFEELHILQKGLS